jgi:hypothetical protein
MHFHLGVGATTKKTAWASRCDVPDRGGGDFKEDASVGARYMVMTLDSAPQI